MANNLNNSCKRIMITEDSLQTEVDTIHVERVDESGIKTCLCQRLWRKIGNAQTQLMKNSAKMMMPVMMIALMSMERIVMLPIYSAHSGGWDKGETEENQRAGWFKQCF